jgi:GDPmannose 4,6-dehydratase
MLQQEKPEDFVIATGKTTSVREFVRKAFEYIGISILFRGSGENEVGFIGDINLLKLSELGLKENNFKV